MLSKEALDIIFKEARTFRKFLPIEVKDETLKAVYDTLKFGPTAFNSSPGRIYFVKSQAAKERLKPALDPGNVPQTMAAPATAILAWDLDFVSKMRKLSATYDKNPYFEKHPEEIEPTARFNGILMGAYFIVAARAHGLDCGPMGGFNNQKLDEEFFKGTGLRSAFLCNVGYGDRSSLSPRAARLDFEEACKIL